MGAALALDYSDITTERWSRGRLSYKYHEGQKVIERKFRSIPGQLFVANIARQFGKSYWAVSKCIEMAMQKPGARIKYATAFHTDLTEFILPTFDQVLSDCPEHLKPKYKVQGSKWVFLHPCGKSSEIKLVGLDKSPNSLRGNVIDMIVIDEAGFVDNLAYIYASIIVPATLHRPNCKIVFISTPPATPAHAFGDFIQLAELQSAYVKLTIYENPRITEADIDRMAEAMGGKHTSTFRRECLCELILDDDLAIVREWDDQYAIESPKDKYYYLYHRYVGMDLGRKDHTALVFGYYDFKRATLCIEDEMTMEGSSWTTETLNHDIKAKEKELWGNEEFAKGKTPPFRRISDNNNPHLIIDLSSLHNLIFNETNKESLEAMVNEVRIMVGAGKIEVNPKCKRLIGCLKYGLWDKKRKEFSRSKIYGHFDHLAALIYLVRNLAKNSNPIPLDFGHENHRSWLRNIKDKQSPSAEALKTALLPKRRPIP